TWASRRGVDSTPRRSPLSGIDAQPASRTALPAVNTVARLVVHRPRRTRSPPPTRSLLVPGAGPVPVVVVAVPVPVVARAVRGRGRVPGRAPGAVAVGAGGGAVVRSGRRAVRPGIRRSVRLFRLFGLSVRPAGGGAGDHARAVAGQGRRVGRGRLGGRPGHERVPGGLGLPGRLGRLHGHRGPLGRKSVV